MMHNQNTGKISITSDIIYTDYYGIRTCLTKHVYVCSTSIIHAYTMQCSCIFKKDEYCHKIYIVRYKKLVSI